MTAHEIIALLPLLNLILVPVARSLWKTSKRLDVLEFNQRRVCEKLEITYIEGKP